MFILHLRLSARANDCCALREWYVDLVGVHICCLAILNIALGGFTASGRLALYICACCGIALGELVTCAILTVCLIIAGLAVGDIACGDIVIDDAVTDCIVMRNITFGRY